MVAHCGRFGHYCRSEAVKIEKFLLTFANDSDNVIGKNIR
jgi:hypothetical protein